MERLNFTETSESPYKFMGAMLAPKGAYYIGYYPNDEWADLYPVMYIQLWQDPNGAIWNVPLWSEEIQETFAEDGCTFQEYIEEVINEDRHIQTCLTCRKFVSLCRRIGHTDAEKISLVMENYLEYVISGEVATTPELRDYFKNGDWGDLRTMENDGTLYDDFEEEYLKPDGSLKPRLENVDATT